MGILSKAYFAKKNEAEAWKRLRQDALDVGNQEASIAYGWVAIRLMNEALTIADADLAAVK